MCLERNRPCWHRNANAGSPRLSAFVSEFLAGSSRYPLAQERQLAAEGSSPGSLLMVSRAAEEGFPSSDVPSRGQLGLPSRLCFPSDYPHVPFPEHAGNISY